MKIKEWLKDPLHWCQLYNGTNAYGWPIGSTFQNPAVCSTCLLGAVLFCYQTHEDQVEVLRKLNHAVECFITWNDWPGRTHGEVLALVEKLEV